MIKNYKLFNKINENYIKDEYLTNLYKDKFFFPEVYMNKYDWKKELYYIVLIDKILLKKYNNRYWTNGDCFTVTKKNKIISPGGYGMDYLINELNNFKFYTADEFYKKDPYICEKLYLKILNDLKDRKINNYDWYGKMLLNYKRVLSNVKELKYIETANNYNI